MNINNNLVRNYHTKRINEMKQNLRNERYNALNTLIGELKKQKEISKSIKIEKKFLKEKTKQLKDEQYKRDERSKNTYRLFKNLIKFLSNLANNNAERHVTAIIPSHDKNGYLTNSFIEGYIDFDLLQCLCNEYDITLRVSLNYEEQSGTMNLTVNTKTKLNKNENNNLKLDNMDKMNYFYKYYAKNKVKDNKKSK